MLCHEDIAQPKGFTSYIEDDLYLINMLWTKSCKLARQADLQRTSLSQMGPSPEPNNLSPKATPPVNPSCLQTTRASEFSPAMIITNSTPFPIMVDFNTSLVGLHADKTDLEYIKHPTYR